MSTTLIDSPAQIVQALLVQLGLATDPVLNPGAAWPAFVRSEPNVPDDCITVKDTAGVSDGRSMINGELWEHYGFQIRVRSTSDQVGWNQAEAIREGLAKVYMATVKTPDNQRWTVQAVTGIKEVLPLGKDTSASKRSLFTVNAMLPLIVPLT